MISARLLVPSLLVAFATTASAQLTVGTGAPPTNQSYVGSVLRSDGYIETWGQTFRAPDASNVLLDSWSFWTNNVWAQSGYGSMTLRLEIIEWPGTCVNCYTSTALGTSLYSGAEFTVPASTTPQRYEFDVGLVLDGSRTYLAFLRPVDFTFGSNGSNQALSGMYFQCNPSNCGGTGSTDYADGSLVWLYTPAQYNQNTNTYSYDMSTWVNMYNYGTNYDTKFEATFAPTTVPEPATLSLLGIGLAGAAMARRRRKQQQQP